MTSTPILPLDYGVEAILGNTRHSDEPDRAFVRIGHNPAVGTTSRGIWELGTAFPFPQQAETVRVRAGGNANDTAAGTGAREVILCGVNAAGVYVREELILAGASASAVTANAFWRICECFVKTAGTYGGANIGDVIVEQSTSTDIMAYILATNGISQQMITSANEGRTLLITALAVFVEGTKSINLQMFMRTKYDVIAGDMGGTTRILSLTALEGNFQYTLPVPFYIPPGFTEIWAEAQTAVGTSAVTMHTHIIEAADSPARIGGV